MKKLIHRVCKKIIQGITLYRVNRIKEKNYKEFLNSGEQAIEGDLPYDLDIVAQNFEEKGFKPIEYEINKNEFLEYYNVNSDLYSDYKNSYGELFIEKALEHYMSLQFSKLDLNSKVIDIANAGSPFPDIVNRQYGCAVWSNDLIFKKGKHELNSWHTQIGCDATKLPLEDNFFDLVVLHCAIEMFEGDNDTKVIKEAERILKVGGAIVIVPLYMNQVHHILRDPMSTRRVLPAIDEGAKLIYRKDFYGVSFSRFYSVDALYSRIINCTSHLSTEIYRITNLADINDKCYLNWILVFRKNRE